MGKRRGKKARLEMAVAALNRRFGPRAVVRGESQADADAPRARPRLPTGFPALDEALGIGGLPLGRISDAIRAGANTVEKVNRATGSGSGDCKAKRCRPLIEEMLRNGGRPPAQAT